MPEYTYPGVYIDEIDTSAHPIEGVSTTTAALVGFTADGPLTPVAVTSFTEYQRNFGLSAAGQYLSDAVRGFFENGGTRCYILRLPPEVADAGGGQDAGSPAEQALVPLDGLTDISLVCCPDEHSIPGMTAALVVHCQRYKDRVAILSAALGEDYSNIPPAGSRSAFAAYYAPWVVVPNPAGGAALSVHPGGHVTGAIALTDVQRGVWKAPADVPLVGIVGLERTITEQQQATLNDRGVNVLRDFPGHGIRIWGARTTSSSASEWKYLNVRRLLIYLEQSIQRGLQWAVFEPNGELLWANVRQTVEDFLHDEWRKGALQGLTPKEGYFARCDRSTMTQDDIDNGRLVCMVGVAPVQPAEFVIFKISIVTSAEPPPSN